MKSLNKKKSWSSFFTKFSMPHAFTMLLGILMIVGIFSLILQGQDTGGVTETKEKIIVLGSGILDWFLAIGAGFKEAFWIITFLFILGGFINVVIKSQALEAMIGKLSSKFTTNVNFASKKAMEKNSFSAWMHNFKEVIRQTWIIMLLMLFFSFAGSTYGMAEESLAFYAIIIPLALVAGFDVWTGFLIVFVGAGVGVMGSTINPFSVLTAIGSGKDALPTGDAKNMLESNGLAWRWISWVVFTMFSIAFVCWYAIKVKLNKERAVLKDMFEVHKQIFTISEAGKAPTLTKKRLITFVIFVCTFLFMVLAMLQWDNLTGSTNMKDLEGNIENVNKQWIIKENGVFSDQKNSSWFHNSLISNKMFTWSVLTFGAWFFEALVMYFFIITLIIGFINWRGEKTFIVDVVDGAKDMLGVCFAIGIAKSIGTLLKATNLETYVVNGISKPIEGLKGDGARITIPLFSYILFIPLTFLIPSTSGLATATFPILSPAIAKSAPETLSGTATAYAWAAGWANLFVPTYGVVIGALAVVKLSYGRFIKQIWKFLAALFFLGMLMIILGGLTGLGNSESTIF